MEFIVVVVCCDVDYVIGEVFVFGWDVGGEDLCFLDCVFDEEVVEWVEEVVVDFDVFY